MSSSRPRALRLTEYVGGGMSDNSMVGDGGVGAFFGQWEALVANGRHW